MQRPTQLSLTILVPWLGSHIVIDADLVAQPSATSGNGSYHAGMLHNTDRPKISAPDSNLPIGKNTGPSKAMVET